MLDWQPLYSPAVYVLAGLGLVGLLVLAYRFAVASKNRRWILFGLRGLVFAGLIVLLLNPIDRRETELPPNPPSVALLVDCSQSMSLGIGQSRLDRVKQSINSVTRSISAERPFHFDLYRFGSRLARVPGLGELSSNEDRSDLAEALDRLPSRLTVDPPRAVILFSDGAVAQSDALDQIAGAYRDFQTPIHTMLPADDQLRGDVAITKLAVPARVASGDQATIRAVIESHGFAQQRLIVSIRPSDRPDATPLAELPITLADGETPCELVVQADSSLSDLVLEVPVQEGEAVSTNNRIPFRLGDRDRTLKVLYMEGTTAQEYRWLENALHEDPDIECVSMVVNNQYAARPVLQRIGDRYRGFPTTRQELFEYDVVICSDISRAAFTPEQIDWTVELVANRGGGFIMVGGHTSFGSGGWDRTPWEKLIAFDMSGRRDYLAQGFAVDVPVEVESHPIWNLLDDPDENRAALEAMPRFGGTNLISRVKPAATLLGKTRDPLARVGIMPVFACETYGRGRTFAMSTDCTADWGRYFESQWGKGDNRYYRKFWRNVVRWLAENSQASQNRLIVRTDQVIYTRDQPIEVVVEAYDPSFNLTTDYQVTAKLVDESASELDPSDSALQPLNVRSSLKQYTGSIPTSLQLSGDASVKPLQSVNLIVQAWDGNEEVAIESIPLQIIGDSTEWLRPQARPETLQHIAEIGGGRFLSGERELANLLRSIEASDGEVLEHQLPLWDHTMIWVAMVGALAIEWTIRRRGAETIDRPA